MPQNADHFWILDVLNDIEFYARAHDQEKVAALIHAAIGAVNHALGSNAISHENIGTKEEQWFDVVLDELARYCHMHGLSETEGHLLAALEAWNGAQEKKETDHKVVTFRPAI